MTDRIPCLIPGCRRTASSEEMFKRLGWVPGEIICGKHWRAVPKRLRRRLAKIRRRAKRDPRWNRLDQPAWLACRRAAIEEAFMGVQI